MFFFLLFLTIGLLSLDSEPIQCSLNYWDDLRGEYVELAKFPLHRRYSRLLPLLS